MKALRYLLPALMVGLIACVGTQRTSSTADNIASMYNPGQTSLHPEFLVQHQATQGLSVMVRVLRDELLFSRANRENKLTAQLDLHLRLYADPERQQLIDSTTIRREVAFARNPIVVSVASLRSDSASVQHLDIWVRDGKRMRTYQGALVLNTQSQFGGHRYYSTLLSNDTASLARETMNFYTWVPDSFATKIYSVNQDRSIQFVSHYRTGNYLPAAPYVEAYDSLLLQPDTTFTFGVQGFEPHEPGFYFFRSDTLDSYGYGLLHGASHYPELRRAATLLEPLAYLCSPAEYQQLLASPNKKLALDEFWMAATHDYSKAKQLIRVYYNRSKFANIYFASVYEGWRTDRGMVFLMMGPPEVVYRTARGERWEYGNSARYRQVVFDFDWVQNPYTTNHYVLRRKTDYRSVWRSAVRSWRDGRIYNGEERQPASPNPEPRDEAR